MTAHHGKKLINKEETMENLLMLRRRMAVAKGSDKPYDAEVEFLESSGTQYIDLGMPVQYTDEMYMDAEATGSSGGVYGAWQQSPTFCHATITHSGIWLGARYYCGSFTVGKNRYEFTNDDDKFYFRAKGAATYSSQNFNSKIEMSKNFYLFATNNNGTASCGGVKIYSFSVKRNGELVLDMIPVRIGQVGYMYDKVSGVLFENKGTGDFTLGNDL